MVGGRSVELVTIGQRRGVGVAMGERRYVVDVDVPGRTVVIGGLISSTLLTLVVLPTLYKWFDEVPAEA